MTPDNRPTHLRPVPARRGRGRGGAGAPGGLATGTPGLTRPLGRGNSSRFLTDVIVELGYVTRERVDQVIAEARTAGRAARRADASSAG